jgi:hypothetical protein
MEQIAYIQKINIRVPQNVAWRPELAEQLIVSLYAIPRKLTLRIESQNGGLGWSIVIQRTLVKTIEELVFGFYPEASVVVTETKPAVGYRLFEFQAAEPFIMPLSHVQDFGRKTDPLTPLLAALSRRQKGGHYIFECQMSPASRKHIDAGQRMLKKSNLNWTHFLTGSGAIHGVLKKAIGADKVDRFESRTQRILTDKLNSPLRAVKLFFKVKDSSHGIKAFLSLLRPAMATFERPGSNALVASQDKAAYPLILSPQELASLWHLPNDACAQANIAWATGIARPVPFVSSAADEVILGLNKFRGKSTPVGIGYEDRETHVNVLGKTGMGKSNMFVHMIHQDIARGKGVGVIDAHGDSVEDILHCSIPLERAKDVVLFDVQDRKYPVGLNLMVAPKSLGIESAASHTLAVLRKLFAEGWSATRMEDAMYAALAALQSRPGSTIQDVTRLFADGQFRHQVLATVKDPIALEFWLEEYEAFSTAQQQQMAQPISNRIRKLYRDPAIRRIICQAGCLDFREIMDGGQIFLAKLGGPNDINTKVLGTLLVSKMQMAALSRADVNKDDRRPFNLYIDEAQNFITTSLDKILSEARKYGLRMAVGNQFLHQLSGKTLEAVMGNMGTTIIFRVGHKDAKALAPFVHPQFSEQDLISLDKYNAIIKMQRKGKTIPAFNLQTMPPLPLRDNPEAQAAWIRSLSRTRYARRKADVDAQLQQRYDHGNGGSIDDGDGDFFD